MAKIGKKLTAYSADTTSIDPNDGFVVNGTGLRPVAELAARAPRMICRPACRPATTEALAV